MSIYYTCSHCGVNVGVLEEKKFHTDQLGFNLLTAEERIEMIETDDQGNMTVKTICEDCQEALERNPVYHQLDRFIQ